MRMNIRPIDTLTPRERSVLLHMMHGLSADQIASEEYVTVCTVRSHIRSILFKLRVNSQLAAVSYANKLLWPSEEEYVQAFTVVAAS